MYLSFQLQYELFEEQQGYFKKFYWGSETLHMTFEGFGEIFDGDFADTGICKLWSHNGFLFAIS